MDEIFPLQGSRGSIEGETPPPSPSPPLSHHHIFDMRQIFSPEMGKFLKGNLMRVYLEQMNDSTCCRGGFRRIDVPVSLFVLSSVADVEQDSPFLMCNFIISVKRDRLGLPQLFVLHIIPDTKPADGGANSDMSWLKRVGTHPTSGT